VAKLIYSTIASVDGYVADAAGAFQWAAPDEEVFAFVNELERPIGTYLFGRRMYETMVSWETAADLDEHPVEREFARLWRAADKVVYSTSLASVASARTRIERGFDPGAVRSLKATADRDLTVGGPRPAGRAPLRRRHRLPPLPGRRLVTTVRSTRGRHRVARRG